MAIQPESQRPAVALEGVVVAVKNAGLASALAALLDRRLARRHRPGVIGVRGFGRVQPLVHPAGQRVIGEAPLELGEQLASLASPPLFLQIRQALQPFLRRLLLEPVPNR